MEYNPREKEYYCQKCKTYVTLIGVNPSCEKCGETLIVVLTSLLDGSRITGNDELVKSDFGATCRTRKS